ncbi:unnamed protein product [Dibothriocephalus latus]|uniref:DNA-directed RNA polymerase N-terminal domain-containing protein n=1 Tax=Dibothriocephalus latus TaxID=60516 RepID=A0A3P6TUK1_DIBLA|nr:unnamed protein product [Dibothriocephalus latus]
MKNSLRNILTALLYVQPGRYPQLSFFPFRPSTIIDAQSQMITDRVSSTLRSSTVSKENVYADVFADATAMTNAFQTQLKLEMAGMVSVAPVLPFFEDMCKTPKGTIVAPASKSGSPVKTTRTIHGTYYQWSSHAFAIRKHWFDEGRENEIDTTKAFLDISHKNLMLEQSLWSKQLIRAFEATLQRLKSAHAHGQITAYPFLKIMPRKAYVDLLIRTVNSIITDSELQHVSRSLLLVRLGERVEDACAVWRKQNLGIIDELKLTYEIYANLYTSQERKAGSVREAWLRALQVRSEDGICLNPQWPQWNSHIRLMVGQELYRILYDHLTFNLNGVRLPVSSSSSSSSDKDVLPRQEAPVLFEVSSENPAESRCEIRYSYCQCLLPSEDRAILNMHLLTGDSTRLIRRPNYFYGTDAAANDDLDFDASKVLLVLDALNALASCPWKVNTPILDALIQVGRSGGDSGLTIPETKSLPPLKPKKISRLNAHFFWSCGTFHPCTRSLKIGYFGLSINQCRALRLHKHKFYGVHFFVLKVGLPSHFYSWWIQR